jgi:hypothetical protein
VEAPESAAGKIIACPSCDADILVPVPASAQIIEVRAEGLNDPEPEPDYEDDPFFNPAHQRPFSDQGWGRTILVQRTSNGSGCCLLGCLGVLFFLYLAFRGFLSLFQ